ncbi:MAG: hypothetical protein QM698_10565 [Micropepsaceae bacterium]
MRRLIVLFAAALMTSGAGAFGTVEGLGQSSEHEKITRLALMVFHLGPDTLDSLAGERGAFGAVGAPDRPDRGLMSERAAHCDGGDYVGSSGYPQSKAEAEAKLTACRDFIFTALDAAVKAAGRIVPENTLTIMDEEIPTLIPCLYDGSPGRAKCDVLEQLGLAMHAAQDFYAHTNWVDVPAPGALTTDNPAGLRQAEPSSFIDPAFKRAFPEGLISGCYEGFPESQHCTYNGDWARVKHAVLNKDNGPIDPLKGATGPGTTPRGAINGNFERAVMAAASDTRSKWAWFKSELLVVYGPERGRLIACAIEKDDPDDCK